MRNDFNRTFAVWLAAIALHIGLAESAAAQDMIGSYPLDTHSRTISPKGRVRCPDLDLVQYGGESVRYSSVIVVHPAFRDRLKFFEQVVIETAMSVYGRAPKRILHKGGFNCRRINRYPDYISEHGLGNAIDVFGFDFGPVPPGRGFKEGLPKRLRRAFKVRLLAHWDAPGPRGAVHSTFLRLLASRLIERQDIFRVVLGPAWPGHHNHYHFDCGPYRLVEVFDKTQDPFLITAR